MKISKQARHEAKQLLQSCRADGLLNEGRIRQALQAVVTRKPRGYVAILTHFQRLVRLDLQRRAARVESAVPLTAAQQAAVQGNLLQRYGPGVNIAYSHKPALLAGLRVQVGSDVYDGSVQARLNALADTF
jgi:F-type H+-transporting ATPase subunit delta